MANMNIRQELKERRGEETCDKGPGFVSHAVTSKNGDVFPTTFAHYEDHFYGDAINQGCAPELWGTLGSAKYKVEDLCSEHARHGPLPSINQLYRATAQERAHDHLGAIHQDELKSFPGKRKQEGLYGSLKGYAEEATREPDSALWAQMGSMKYQVGGLLPAGRWELRDVGDGEYWEDPKTAELRMYRSRERELQRSKFTAQLRQEYETHLNADLAWRIRRDQEVLERELGMQKELTTVAQQAASNRAKMLEEQAQKTAYEYETNMAVGRHLQQQKDDLKSFSQQQEEQRKALIEAHLNADQHARKAYADLQAQMQQAQQTYHASHLNERTQHKQMLGLAGLQEGMSQAACDLWARPTLQKCVNEPVGAAPLWGLGRDSAGQFDRIDRNKDGVINRNEYLAAYGHKGDAAANAAFDRADVNKDGVITNAEFELDRRLGRLS